MASNVEEPLASYPKAVLFINRSDSRCSACNGNAWMNEYRHRQTGKDKPGCGAFYVGVSSHYVGMENVVPDLRPDLTWYDPLSGDWPVEVAPGRLW